MNCAIGLPNVGEYGDPRLLVTLAEEAEAAGWAGVFVWDHVAYRERGWPVADPYVVVTAIAAATSRVRVGVLVSALARRRPWKLARETASLDVLSDGRLVVGAGLGSQAHEEFALPLARIPPHACARRNSMRAWRSWSDCGAGRCSLTAAATTRLMKPSSALVPCSGRVSRSGLQGAGPPGRHFVAPRGGTACLPPSTASGMQRRRIRRNSQRWSSTRSAIATPPIRPSMLSSRVNRRASIQACSHPSKQLA